jgi:hypothetical protein
MLNAALRYAELGYAVFPCAVGAKNPLTRHGLKDATTDSEQVERFWAATPDANIGIATNGLFVLDIDGASNPFLADQPDRFLELSRGVLSLTPRGGRHYFFRQPVGRTLRNTAGKIAVGVDTRAQGGYVLAYPSIVDGKQYSFPSGELDVSPEQLSEPPTWLLDLLDSPGVAPASVRLSDSQPANTIPDGQRNSTLAQLGGTMRRVGMSQDEIYAALAVANAGRCKPPLSDDEVRTIALSVARYEPDGIAVAVAEGHFEQMGAGAEPANENKDPGTTPPHLLKMPGFVGDLSDYILATAPYPEPSLSFAGSLAAQSFLAAQKIQDESGARSSLYLVSLANSGAGKDWPRKIIKNLFMEAGLIDHIVENIASAEGLEDLLYVRPSLLWLADEFHTFLAAIRSGKDLRNEAISKALLTLFGSADSPYPMRARAGRPTTIIDQPGLSVLGSSIPSEFYGAMSPRMISNGLFARLLILEAGKRVIGQRATKRPLPQSVLDAAKWWANFRPGETRGNLAVFHPTPKIVPASAAAESIFDDLRADADRLYGAAEDKQDDAGTAAWTRCLEKARRLALNFAASVNHKKPEITEAAATWGADVARHQSEKMLFMAGAHVAESPFDGECKRAEETLRRWRERKGDEWMPESVFNRRQKKLTPREQKDVREALLSQGRIEREQSATGRPGSRYRIRSC